MKNQLQKLLGTAVIYLVLSGSLMASGGSVIYVNQNASGMNNGSSWEDAYIDLSEALENATTGTVLWVAAGTYFPGADTTSSFFIDENIWLLGGFAGDETDISQRDPDNNPTILSGDLNQDDMNGHFDVNRSDNVLTVLILSENLTAGTVIDGFIIRGGHSDGDDTAFENKRGGGIFSFGQAIINNCRIEMNFADAGGGGIYYQGLGAEGTTLSNCSIYLNAAGEGGGIMTAFNEEVGISISDCDFLLNQARDNGGAIKSLNSQLQVANCQFEANSAVRNGGAIDVYSDAFYYITNISSSEFLDNFSTRGGAIRWNFYAGLGGSYNELHIHDCNFVSNDAAMLDPESESGRHGGAVYASISSTAVFTTVEITESTFLANMAETSGGAMRLDINGQYSTVNLQNNDFIGNQTEEEGGVYINANNLASGDFTFNNCSLSGNTADENYAGLFLRNRGNAEMNYTLVGNTFDYNTSSGNGGALTIHNLENAQSDLYFENCEFYANSALGFGSSVLASANNDGLNARFYRCGFTNNSGGGGSVFAAVPEDENEPLPEGSNIHFDNCLIAENSGGSVIYCDSFPALQMTNNTIAYNSATALHMNEASSLKLQNNILDNPGFSNFVDVNGDTDIQTMGGNIISDESMNGLLGGADKTNTLPLFSIAGLYEYELSEMSPAIDAGILPADWPEFDFAGNDRVQGGGIDAGALESPFVSSTDEAWLNSFEVRVSPNPASDYVVVDLLAQDVGNWTFSLTDINGRILQSHNINHQGDLSKHEFLIKDLPSGLYFLILQQEGNAFGVEVVKP
ncbi:MAG: T9SS type A sorting domain-containing protein [Bacteroidetes bacterium]|nr:T9SS type A sorting domain-containing protein [Bacteroidota bacterium]